MTRKDYHKASGKKGVKKASSVPFKYRNPESDFWMMLLSLLIVPLGSEKPGEREGS